MADPQVLYGRLLELVAETPEIKGCGECGQPHGSAAAVRAVLELHAPVESTSGPLQCVECAAQCHSGSGLSCDYPDAEYPCATVKAIASAWGVDSEIIR